MAKYSNIVINFASGAQTFTGADADAIGKMLDTNAKDTEQVSINLANGTTYRLYTDQINSIVATPVAPVIAPKPTNTCPQG